MPVVDISRLDQDELSTMVVGIMAALVLIIVVCLILMKGIESKDMSMPPVTIYAKIVEKRINQNYIKGAEWYVVEDNQMGRYLLRNLHPGQLFLSVGDYGLLTYQGKTITAFQRLNHFYNTTGYTYGSHNNFNAV